MLQTRKLLTQASSSSGEGTSGLQLQSDTAFLANFKFVYQGFGFL